MDSETTIKYLKDIQAETEDTYWASMPELEDIRHTIMHMNKMIGQWSTLVEVYEHYKLSDPPIKAPKVTDMLRRKLVSNLLIWTLHYANLYGYDMSDLYMWKIQKNKDRTDSAMRFANAVQRI